MGKKEQDCIGLETGDTWRYYKMIGLECWDGCMSRTLPKEKKQTNSFDNSKDVAEHGAAAVVEPCLQFWLVWQLTLLSIPVFTRK